MEEPFILTVPYKGKEKEVEAQLLLYGYTHKFCVDVDGTEVFFERDEEGSYRAILPLDMDPKDAAQLDKELLMRIAQKIEEILA